MVGYLLHYKGHGDVVQLTDQSGNVVASYTYDAWGNILNSSGAMANSNPYRYAGYRFDSESGVYYLNSRYYSSNLGRFISRDKFQGFLDEPLSLNQYAYCENNPVNRIDPDGHSWLSTAGAVLGVVSFGVALGILISGAPVWMMGATAVGVLSMVLNTLAWLNEEINGKQFGLQCALGLTGFGKGDLARTIQQGIAGGSGAYGVANWKNPKNKVDLSRAKRILKKLKSKGKRSKRHRKVQ
ncbi:MAG: RHS repeat domain-containing protein [Chitinophagales bacterium]